MSQADTVTLRILQMNCGNCHPHSQNGKRGSGYDTIKSKTYTVAFVSNVPNVAKNTWCNIS